MQKKISPTDWLFLEGILWTGNDFLLMGGLTLVSCLVIAMETGEEEAQISRGGIYISMFQYPIFLLDTLDYEMMHS